MTRGRLLRRASRRALTRHPWQLGVSILGVALGVAVTVSVALANAAAMRAFDLSNAAITGPATHQIVAGDGGLDEQIFLDLRIEMGIRRSAPIVEGWVASADDPSRALRVVGVDPFSEATLGRAFTGRLGSRDAGIPIDALMGAGTAAIASPETLAGLEMDAGMALRVITATGETAIQLVDGWPPDGRLEALRDVLVMDIAAAQDLVGGPGRLSRIDLILEAHEEQAVATALPPGAVLSTATARSEASRQMTRAFRLNLTAMSLLALLCGLFLIFNTMTFAVVRRRELFGSLRAIGVTRGQVLGLVLGEGLAIGLLGTLAGLVGGVVIAQRLVTLVVGTINDLYFALEMGSLSPSPWVLAAGSAVGVVGTLAASLAPAIEASTTSPRLAMTRSALESGTRRRLPRVALFGAIAVAAGAGAIAATDELVPTFAGLFVAVIGVACWSPALTLLLAATARRPLRALLGAPGNLAARGISASLSRMSVAVAALTIAISLIIGVRVMVGSFRSTLIAWLQYTLDADLFIAPGGPPGRTGDLVIDPVLLAGLQADPEVAAVATLRRRVVESSRGPTLLLAVGGDSDPRRSHRLLEAIDDPWTAFARGSVLVSESLAFHRGLGPGDRISLPTDAGEAEFAVAGVYASFASDRGAVLLSRAAYDGAWDDPGLDGVSLTAASGVELEGLRSRLRTSLAADSPLTIVSTRELRERSLIIFDRTFLITGVLQFLVAAVAFVGVLSALMALQLERRREFGMLRAAGMTPRQLWSMLLTQTTLIGSIAGVLAVPLGIALAWVMIFVINRRSFGWTLTMEVPPVALAQAVGLAVAAALLAGLLPAVRAARSVPAGGLRDE